MGDHLEYLSEGVEAAIIEACAGILRECTITDEIYAGHQRELLLLQAELEDVLEGEGVAELSASRHEALKEYIRILKFVHARGMTRVYLAGARDRAAIRRMLSPLLDGE